MTRVCIGCEAEQGQPHKTWCPTQTGTLATLPEPERMHREGTDWVTCPCGNQPDSNGFWCCLPDGTVVEPDSVRWDGRHYVCASCGRIFDETTSVITGRRPVPLTAGEADG